MPAAGQVKQFNRPYNVSIREELPIGGKAALALLTPVTVAADGVVVLLGIALVPFLAIGAGGVMAIMLSGK